MRRLCLPAVLVLLSNSMPATAAELDALLLQLKRTPPTTESFHDVRYRRALTQALISQGQLTWHGEFDFERVVESPYRERARLQGRSLVIQRERGGERIIPLARAPELEVLFSGLAALFSGDAAAIERSFEVELEPGEPWRLRLKPRDQRLRERVTELELRGQAGQVRCLIVHQPDTQTLSLFARAQVPEAGDMAGMLATACPAP